MPKISNIRKNILIVVIVFFIFLIIHHLLIKQSPKQNVKENFSSHNESYLMNESPTQNINESENTLFVSIPSYRDEDCKNTVKDLFETAKNPELIYVGVFTQNKYDYESCNVDIKYKNNIRYLDINYKEAKGPLYARAKILSELYRNETYYMMIDAHSRFIKDWDFNLKKQLNYLRNKGISKPILSTYPNDQINMENEINKPSNEVEVTHICGVSEGEDYPTVLKGILKKSGIFYKSHFIAGGFLFTYGQFCKEARLDTSFKHIFVGEEILIAILAYTNGWDVYSPAHNYIYHKYKSMSPPWFTDNKDNDGFDKESMESHEKIKRILIDPTFSLNDPYGIGKVRSLNSFWTEVGFNKNEKEFNKKWTDEKEDILCNKQKNIVYNE